MKNILFVCLGNICRSPTARCVFERHLRRAGLDIETDSAGTAGFHQGCPADPRAIEHAGRIGVDLSAERARQVTARDFHHFDLILAMDRSNLEALEAMAPGAISARLELVMSLAPDYGLDEVPDPYYGGSDGFERVLDMLEAAASGLVRELSQRSP